MKDLLEFIISNLVSKPDAVSIDEEKMDMNDFISASMVAGALSFLSE